jgi:hypothetical protein
MFFTKDNSQHIFRGLRGGKGGSSGGSKGGSSGGNKGGGYNGGYTGGGYNGGGYTGGGYNGGYNNGYNNGYSNGYNNNNYSNTSGGSVPSWVTIMIIIIVISIIVACCCYFKHLSKSSKTNPNVSEWKASDTSPEYFKQQANDAKEAVMEHSEKCIYSAAHAPTDGLYDMSYVDDGQIHTGIVTLSFTDNGKGYSLSGTVADVDGQSTIIDDFVTYDGKAYWQDRCTSSSSGDEGLLVVTEGTFDFVNSTFSGSWTSSTGRTGSYTKFVLIKADPESQINESVPATFGNEEEEIVVAAVPVVPVIPTAPLEGTSIFDELQSEQKFK